MSAHIFANKYLLRILAIICLILGLREAAHFLTQPSDEISLLNEIGVWGFFLSLSFLVFRLLASVGMWIKAKWGAPLALIIVIVEFALFFLSPLQFYISTIGVSIRVILVLGLIAYFAIIYLTWRKFVHH